MKNCIEETLAYARECKDYKRFREWFYANRLRPVTCDSRETVPVALSMFYLAQGDPAQTILYAVNFGRDADTIGTMAGALAGAFSGAGRIREEWLDKHIQTDVSVPTCHTRIYWRRLLSAFHHRGSRYIRQSWQARYRPLPFPEARWKTSI